MNLIRGLAEPQPFKERIVEPESIPGQILEKLNSGVYELQKLGFTQFWYFANSQTLTGGGGYAVEGLHSSKQIIAKVIYVYFKARERQVIALFSGVSDGIVLATTNKKREFNPLPKHIVQRKVGAEAEELLAMHQKKMADFNRANTLRSFASLEDVAGFEDRLIGETYDDKIRRGIWVEMTEAEVAALRAQPAKAHFVPPR
jgi:hypothetical protein